MLVPLEVLNLAFVLLGGGPRLECAQIATLSGFRIFLTGVQAIFAGLKLSNHTHPRLKNLQAPCQREIEPSIFKSKSSRMESSRGRSL
jgi:hypothetical protein